MKRTVLIAITATLLAAGAVALAAGPFSNPKVVQALKLTPEQQQKLEDLRYQRRKDGANLRRDMELKRLDLERELDKDTPDVAALDRLLDEQGALRTKMGKARIHQMLDMKKILTPEQWNKVRDRMRERRAERIGNRRGPGGFGPGGRQGQGQGMAPGGRGGRGGQGFGRPDGPPPQGGPGGPGQGPGPGAGSSRDSGMDQGPGSGPGPGGPQLGPEGEDGLAGN